MQKHIQGTLRDPTGSILPNHEIRITSRSNITELHSVELTDSNGEYSFILTEGWKYLEVLFRNTYLLVGDILINEAAPAECTIEEILRYSTPIVVSSIYDLPTGINSLQETLEDGAYTFKREDRDQLIDTLVYKIDLTNSWVSDDMLERGIRDISEVSTCDSSIKDIKQVYSDDKGNSFSHSTGSIKTKDGEVKSEVLVSDTIRTNEDITLGNYSYNLSKDINATTVTNSITKTKGSVVIQDSDTFTDTSLTKVKYATTEAGTFTDTTTLNSSNYTRNTSFNNIHQTTITINDTLVQDSSTVSINGVVSTDVFTHDGTSTQRNINIDKYVVGREGNDLFEVDSTTDTVTVRGNLRIQDIQDPDGNSLIPDDGDTIFQVFRYGETASGPWEDVLQSYHYWKQENYSINGYIDPNGWSVAYKFRGEDGAGSPGDTIFFEYQYSPDGATDWSTELKAGDAFRRERRVVNGNPEAWSEPVRIKGENGDEIEIRSQYSVDGINNWHNTFLSTDKYERRARFVNGVQDSAWSDPFKIQGTAVFKSIVFKRSAVEPDRPTGGTFDNSIPDGWEDGIPAGELQLWGSTRVFSSDGSSPQEAEWSAPQIMTDTSTLDYEYSAISLEGNPGNPTTNPTNWHNTATPADNWMALRKKTNGVFGEWDISQIKGEKGEPGQDGARGPQGVEGPKGADGRPTYTWIRYADTSTGVGISNNPTGKEYIGFAYNKTTPTESNNKSDYTWSLIKGTDGVKGDKGADGQTTYTWIAYSNYADGTNLYQVPNDNTLYIGIAVNKTTATESSNKADYTWSKFKGDDGRDGQDGDPGIPGLNGSGWYSIVNGTGVWPGDAQATANFLNTFGRVPQLDDHLFYVDKDPDPTKTDGRRCITPVGGSPVRWSNPRAYFDGDVIVKGTLSADRLVAQSITGNEIDSQTTIIAGSGSSTAGINGYDLSTLPDWMGGGSNPYAGYRFWAGSSTPEFANFTVDNNGKMKAIDGEFSGTITMIGSSGLKVESNNPFGPDNLLEWRGSREGKLNADGTVNLNLLTRVNATTYYSDDNVAYFGGTIIAGTLTLAKTNPSTSTTVEIATGNFGSNGGQIAIACGFSYSFSNPYVAGTCPVPEPSPPVVTLKLYAVSSGGLESLVNSQTFTGRYKCLQEGPEYFEDTTIIGSFTHFDNEYSTNDRSYILKATRTGVTPQSQRLSIVTQE